MEFSHETEIEDEGGRFEVALTPSLPSGGATR